MNKWQQYRQILLTFAFAGVFLSLGRFSSDASAGNRQIEPLTFPSVVPLPGWQLLQSRPLPETPTTHKSWETVLGSHNYSYSYNNQQLEIEMRYVANTAAELQTYFKKYTSIQLKSGQLLQKLRQRQGVGFYSLFAYQGRSHLTACINPRGGSTVTHAQFFANRYTHDFQPWRVLPWLLSQETIPDKRCLWVVLSLPLDRVSAETADLVLEQAWLSWYQWWSSHFPQLS